MKYLSTENTRKLVLISAAFAACGLVGFGVAAQQAQTGDDTTFARNAAAAGMAEVKLGQLAQENAASQTVKAFGQKMVTDHTKAGDELKAVASKDSINLPMNVSRKDQATYDHLKELNGQAFDVEFAKDMVSDHEKAVSDFQAEANSGTNPDLKNFAAQTLPTLQQHLAAARDMQKTVAAGQ